MRLAPPPRASAILNEEEIPENETIVLPPSSGKSILPMEDRMQQEHPDIRLARRARTIANLARVISERKVNTGLVALGSAP